MNKVKVSIITVVFNNAAAIEKTLQNSLRQTYQEMEVIVIDGASTDGTLDVIKKHADRIRFISEPDSGIYDAMMKGARIATGEWILFRNVGDYFFSDTAIAEVFERYEDRGEDLIACDIRYFQNGWYKDFQPSFPKRSYLDGMPFHHPATFIRRRTQLKYPFPVSYKLSGDYWFFSKVLHDGGTYVHVNIVLSLYDNMTGASTDRYDCSLAENAQIAASLGATKQQVEALQAASFHFKRVAELRRRYWLYDFAYKINYYFKVYRKAHWVRMPLHNILANI